MVKFEMRNSFSSANPPNSECRFLGHPSGDNNKSIQLAMFNDHRFAFYYWVNWSNSRGNALSPDLISFDWHQDLIGPCESLKSELSNIDLNSNLEISFFAWSRLRALNDDHILAAAYLNKLNNIWVVCKQNLETDFADEELVDYQGKAHKIRKFANKDLLFEELKRSSVSSLYLDIDLDYFTIDNSTSNGENHFTYMTDSEIENIFAIDNEFMQWIFSRMDGFTIALEPEHTGNVVKSLKYLSLLYNLFFEITPEEGLSWRHLSKLRYQKNGTQL